MSRKQITILQLYPEDMNIYGDWGNCLVLKRRLEWHGYDPIITSLNLNEDFPDSVDIVVGGGGHASHQLLVASDIARHKNKLSELIESGTPMLLICGMFQLFGHSFSASGGIEIKGIGLLDITTRSGEGRLKGNTVIETKEFGQIVGYENHSGRTALGPTSKPFGKVVKGEGNNGEDGEEGCRLKNTIGTYLHGSILPKNPKLADFLIKTAATNKYGHFEAKSIKDPYVDKARAIAIKRSR